MPSSSTSPRPSPAPPAGAREGFRSLDLAELCSAPLADGLCCDLAMICDCLDGCGSPDGDRLPPPRPRAGAAS